MHTFSCEFHWFCVISGWLRHNICNIPNSPNNCTMLMKIIGQLLHNTYFQPQNNSRHCSHVWGWFDTYSYGSRMWIHVFSHAFSAINVHMYDCKVLALLFSHQNAHSALGSGTRYTQFSTFWVKLVLTGDFYCNLAYMHICAGAYIVIGQPHLKEIMHIFTEMHHN